MAQQVSDYVAVVIPHNQATGIQVFVEAIRNALRDVMVESGGATVTQVQGQWVAPDGEVFAEPGMRYQFNFQRNKFDAVQQAVRRLVDVVFEHGEQAVFRERHYTDSGYKASIIFAPTKH